MSYSVPPPMSFFVRMSPRRTVIAKEELKNFGTPIRPRRTKSMAFRLISSKCRTVRDHQFDAVLVAGVDHCSHSSAVTAIGFSHRTCTPARAARTVYSACSEFGSAIYTASTCSRHAS